MKLKGKFNYFIILTDCVQETVVRRDGVSKLIDLMRNYEDNDEIQVNGCKVIGNIAVNGKLAELYYGSRRRLQ